MTNPISPINQFEQVVDNQGRLTKRGKDFFDALWLRTGGANSNIPDVTLLLAKANNLSDLNNIATARTNLGLGSAALQAASAFLQTANNLSDLLSVATARTNLGLGSLALINSPVPVANGGTNSVTALNNNRIIISSAGAIVEQSALTASKPMRTNASGLPATGNTDLTSEVTGVLPAANGGAVNIAFRANKNGTGQTIGTASSTKVTATTANFNTGSYYDTTNSKFLPLVAGNFAITICGRFTAAVDASDVFLFIFKNGAEYSSAHYVMKGTAEQGFIFSDIVNLNGSTDYVEFYIQQNTGSNKTLSGSSSQTFFCGNWVSS